MNCLVSGGQAGIKKPSVLLVDSLFTSLWQLGKFLLARVRVPRRVPSTVPDTVVSKHCGVFFFFFFE